MLSEEEKKHIKQLFSLQRNTVMKNLNSLREINIFHFKHVIEYVCNDDIFEELEKEMAMEALVNAYRNDIYANEKNLKVKIPQESFLSFLKTMNHEINNTSSKFELVRLIKSLNASLEKEKISDFVHFIESELLEIDEVYLNMLKEQNYIFSMSKYKEKENLPYVIDVIVKRKYDHSDSSDLNNLAVKYLIDNEKELLKEQPYYLMYALKKLNYRLPADSVESYFNVWVSLLEKFNKSETEEELSSISTVIKEDIQSYQKVNLNKENRWESILYEVGYSLLNIYFTLFNSKEAYLILKEMEISKSKEMMKSVLESVPMKSPYVIQQKPFEINEITEIIGFNKLVNEVLLFSIIQKLGVPYIKDTPSEYISYEEGGLQALSSYMTTKTFYVNENTPSADIINFLHQEKLIKLLPKTLLLRLMTDFPHINYNLKNPSENTSLNQRFFEDVFNILNEDMQIEEENYEALFLVHKI